jgi:hypothetical protein
MHSSPCPPFFCSLSSLIISSIRKIVIAASVAYFNDFIFDIAGSKTPFDLQSRTFPA